MDKIVIFLLMSGFCFLFTLNLYLRGTKTEAVGGLLGILILLTIAVSFFLVGWLWGLLFFASSFVLIALFQIPAQALLAGKISFAVLVIAVVVGLALWGIISLS